MGAWSRSLAMPTQTGLCMSSGFKATFRFLARTENEAAVEVLLAGLDSPETVVREESLRALLEHRSPAAHLAVLHRLPDMDERTRTIINERPERLTTLLVETAKDPRAELCARACDAIAACRLYDAMPALATILSNVDNPNHGLVARTMLKLTERFYADLSASEDACRRKENEAFRLRITSSLEDVVRKFHRHHQPETVEALLLLARHDNVALRCLLQRPEESSYHTIVNLLANSQRGGVIRLLLRFLEDSQMPLAVMRVISTRTDLKFVKNLLNTVGLRPSKTIAETLARFDSLAWAEPGDELFGMMDDTAQEQAVALLMATSIRRDKLQDVLSYLLLEGKPGGRRAAAKALAAFQGHKADALVIRAMNDEDPLVRAALITHIRDREIPGAMSLLMRMVGSDSEEIRAALRTALPEFTFRKFLASFDAMDEGLRATAGHMVTKIDSESVPLLMRELECLSPVRRRRAVLAAVAMGVVHELEQRLIQLLSDPDHIVRIAAAKALADCKTLPTWEALRDALLDRSVIVQEAAESSLQQISQWLESQTAEEQPEEIAS